MAGCADTPAARDNGSSFLHRPVSELETLLGDPGDISADGSLARRVWWVRGPVLVSGKRKKAVSQPHVSGGQVSISGGAQTFEPPRVELKPCLVEAITDEGGVVVSITTRGVGCDSVFSGHGPGTQKSGQ